MKNALKKGALVSYLSVIIHVAANLLMVPILISEMGDSEYGLYQMVASLFSYISIFETALTAGVLRMYCTALSSGDKQKAENLLAICRRIYRFLTIVLLACGSVLTVTFSFVYKGSLSAPQIRESTVMLALLFVNLCITMSNAVYLTVINANEHFAFVRGLDCAVQIMNPLVCLLVLKQYPFAVTVITIQLLLNIAVALTRYIYAKKVFGAAIRLHKWEASAAKAILIFSAGIMLSNIADQIFWKTDQLILGKIFDTAAVAVYSVATQIYTNYMYAGTTVASVFMPRIAGLYSEKDGVKLISDLFIRVGRIAFTLTFLVLTGFIIFGRQFLMLWVGKTYLPAYRLALIVMLPYTIDIIQNLGLTILQVMDLFKFRAKVYLLAALSNILLTVVMAQRWGVTGAAVSTAVSMFVSSGIIMNCFYRKKVGIDIVLFWKNIALNMVKLLPLSIAAYVLFNEIIVLHGFKELGAAIAVYTLLYSLCVYFFTFNEYEKGLIGSFLKRVKKRGN